MRQNGELSRDYLYAIDIEIEDNLLTVIATERGFIYRGIEKTYSSYTLAGLISKISLNFK